MLVINKSNSDSIHTKGFDRENTNDDCKNVSCYYKNNKFLYANLHWVDSGCMCHSVGKERTHIPKLDNFYFTILVAGKSGDRKPKRWTVGCQLCLM